MGKSDSSETIRTTLFAAKGTTAARLRRRKYALVRQFCLPEDLLGGSLVLSHRRCGKATCTCAVGSGHPQWTLTYSVDGVKRVESVPAELVEMVLPLVDAGEEYSSAIRELRGINAQLLTLWKAEQRAKQAKSRRKPKNKRSKPRKQR